MYVDMVSQPNLAEYDLSSVEAGEEKILFLWAAFIHFVTISVI